MFASYNTIWAVCGGVLPALLWLWFWLKEDRRNPEPRLRIILSFIAGMVAVLAVIPIEKFFYQWSGAGITLVTLILWAAAEEILKLLAAYFSALKYKVNDEPLDSIIYMLSAALGFSALENTFFLAKLIDSGLVAQSIITSNMRFLGATVLHTVSSAAIGVFLALSFYKNKEIKKNYLFTGILAAIVLHTAFNSFIMRLGQNTFIIFGAIWLSAILLILIFEKIKTIKKNYLD